MMLTKEDFEKAAENYCRQNGGNAFEFQAFVSGAQFIFDYERIERKENEQLQNTISRLNQTQNALK